MAEYRLFFQEVIETSVKVEADDLDEAIDKAYEELPTGICAQCSGWGQEWSRDDGGDAELVEDYHEVDGEWVDVEKEVW